MGNGKGQLFSYFFLKTKCKKENNEKPEFKTLVFLAPFSNKKEGIHITMFIFVNVVQV
jgi:hypothetical protein